MNLINNYLYLLNIAIYLYYFKLKEVLLIKFYLISHGFFSKTIINDFQILGTKAGILRFFVIRDESVKIKDYLHSKKLRYILKSNRFFNILYVCII